MKNKKCDDGILRLIPQRKKGILKLVFSRLFMIILLVLMQIVILLSIYQFFIDFFPHIHLLLSVFSIAMIFYLFNDSMTYSAKLTWLGIIMLFPLPGTILLFTTKYDYGYYTLRKRIESLIGATKRKLPHNKKLMSDTELKNSGTADLCNYINRTGCFPLYDETETEYFPCGEAKFASVLEELEKAENFIFMEYFIIAEGYMWGKILEILRRKAQQGVEVRVMYDGMCEMSTLTHDYPKRMAELGIKCKAFAPIAPFLSTHYNYRDHRKILVIDGKVAYNGGINFADEYINKKERFGHWKDTAVMIKGSAVQSFTLMFLQMWNIDEKEPVWDKWLTVAENNGNKNTQGYVMPYADCPLDDYKVGENVYMDILNRATKYVHIMTPYLVLDGELETSLKFAAERGIDVRIILPGIPDKKTAYALAKTHYKELIKSGVKLYEYTPGFVHSKVFVCDDEKAVVGTINLDYRSLYHHFECATYMYRTSCIPSVEADFQQTLASCRRVTTETIKKEKLYYKIVGQILKLVAPLF
ncbi:MAG: cardiolipin synthase [Ruminococcus flavefaciens]|nr:cardiolipin synthase [Ruminococcus flavefaciens]MCM1231394.1 cardiolipin synthase [Ruminococcus flavefaciens]